MDQPHAAAPPPALRGPRPSRTVDCFLSLAAAAVPQRCAVTLGEAALSFAACDEGANRMAQALRGLGLGPGDRLLTWTGLSLRDIDLFFGAARAGAVYVPLNPAATDQEAAGILAYIRPRLLVADVAHAERAAALARAAAVPLAIIGGAGAAQPGIDLDAATARAAAMPPEGGAEEADAHAIFLTSGSTGAPKGVVVSHLASWRRSLAGNFRSDASGGGGDLCMFPLFHWAGWNFLLIAWAHLRAVHFAGADAGALLHAAERFHAGRIYAIPAVWQRILEQPRRKLPALRIAQTGTSRVEPELLDAIRARLPGVFLSVLYGATELGIGMGLADADSARKPGSVGLPMPGLEATLVDGELCCRADTMMTGYFDLPEQTDAVLVNGWYRTGDLAARDDEGYFTIIGRKREQIRTGGEWVAPAEVEAALRDYPGIADCAIIGLPHPGWGELVCAAIVRDIAHPEPTLEGVRAHLANRLAGFKHPRALEFVAALPRTSATGQIQRSAVRAGIVGRKGGE